MAIKYSLSYANLCQYPGLIVNREALWVVSAPPTSRGKEMSETPEILHRGTALISFVLHGMRVERCHH